MEPNSSTYYVCAARVLTDGSRDGRRCHSPITWEEGLDDKSFGLALLMIGRVQTERDTWTRGPNALTGMRRKHLLPALTLVDIQTEQIILNVD